ncbi:MAG TPA: DHHA1 domain-containing protein, partial [Ilumatobacteraceae bacterium]
RRIEAVTGANSVALLQHDEQVLADVARLVGASADDVVGGVQRRLDEIKALNDELKALRGRLASSRAGELAGTAVDGIVVQRVDDLAPGDLRDLAIAVRQQPGVRRVVLGGITTTGGVSLVAAVQPSDDVVAATLLRDAAKAVGGGGGGKGDVATAGGKDPGGLDEALRIAADAARA